MGEILKPYPYQEEGIKMTLEMKRCINGDEMGLGKEQPYSEPVLTPTGWTEMGKLKVGDTIIAGDGTLTKVTGIYEQGIKPVYKVSFSDGTYARCGFHHLWNVRTFNDAYRRGRDYYRTVELSEILKDYKRRVYDSRYPDSERYNYKYAIPLCGKVLYMPSVIPMSAYVLGVIIGDGNITSKNVRICKPSNKLRKKVVNAFDVRGDYVGDFSSDNMTFSIKNVNGHYRSHTAEILEELGLLGLKSTEKFIPSCYLTSSVADRELLLEGLLDTDGHFIKAGVWEYSTASFELMEDICELARSLGYMARMTERDNRYEDDGKMFHNYRVYIYKDGVRRIKSIINVEEDGEENQRCIVVDHPMHLYITRDFIVTHNTAQSIVAVERSGATPCLVICPSALKVNWEREIRRFTRLRPLILTDANKATFPYFIGTMDMYDVVITNFESLKKFFVVHAVKPYRLKDIVFQNVIRQFKSVIIDESARCKDPSTLQTRLCMGICSGKEYVIELTGTPIINDPKDIATQICILGKIGEFGGYKEFMLRYGDGKHLTELNKAIHEKCYFRRSKKLVLKDLPDLTRTKVVTALSNQSEYDTCERDLKTWLTEYKKLSEGDAKRKMHKEALVRFMNLRKLAGQGKVEAAIQFIEDTTEPIVVFAEHHDVVDALTEAIPDAVCVTGRQDQRQKQWAIDAFQEGKRRVIVCSIKAAGVGLTLTASSNVVFVNLPWHMADLSQCEARCWRNGQKNAVNSWVLIGENTIDEYLFNLIMNKGSVASKITGAGDDALKDERYFEELADAMLGGGAAQ